MLLENDANNGTHDWIRHNNRIKLTRIYIDDDESDAEVFGLGSDDEDEEEELSDDEIVPANKDDSEEEEGKLFQSWRSIVIYTVHIALDQTWGKSKQAYYDADEGDDLDEMREEETEALKIQKEQLAAMDEADFMDEWGTGPGAVSKKKE